ncbi:MAG: hypothetical protein U0T74_13485 [Chitinophagales bacterium]
MPNPNLPPRPGIPGVPKWLIVIPGVLIVIAGIIYIYGELKPGIRPGKQCVDCIPYDTLTTHSSCFVRGASSGECEGWIVRGDEDSSFYVAGTFTTDFRMAKTATLVSKGGLDVFIAKVSNEGNVLWLQSLGGSGDDIPSDIAIDAKGNPLVSINFMNSITVGNATVTGINGVASGLIVKLRKGDGAPLWNVSAVTQGSNAKATILDMDIKENGNILVVGTMGNAAVRFSSVSGASVTLQTQAAGAYLCEYNPDGNVNRVNKFAEGDISDTHLCADRSSERIAVDFNFNNRIDFGGTKYGKVPSRQNIGYAFILPTGSLVPGSCYVNLSTGTAIPGSAQYVGTIVQNQSHQFFIAGHFEREASFGDLTVKSVQINGIVLSVNPVSYKVENILNINGTVSKMRDVCIGAQQQVLFGSSYITSLITENSNGTVEVSYQSSNTNPGTDPANAFIANYTADFQKNWVHRCTSAAFTSGESLTWSVGANSRKLAFTGYALDTVSCDENLPLVMDTFSPRKDFLMKIVDY